MIMRNEEASTDEVTILCGVTDDKKKEARKKRMDALVDIIIPAFFKSYEMDGLLRLFDDNDLLICQWSKDHKGETHEDIMRRITQAWESGPDDTLPATIHIYPTLQAAICAYENKLSDETRDRTHVINHKWAPRHTDIEGPPPWHL